MLRLASCRARTLSSMAHHQLIDIGANLTDPVFKGEYRGKQKHKVRLPVFV